MRFIPLFLVFVLSYSCGKDMNSSSTKTTNEEKCNLDGLAVDCSHIMGADGLGVDLLDTMIEVPIKIDGSEITFLETKSHSEEGRRISCKTAVTSGDIYRYAVRGNKLELQTGSRTFSFERLNEGTELKGTWSWKGYVDQGTLVIKIISFLSGNRAILKTHCEL